MTSSTDGVRIKVVTRDEYRAWRAPYWEGGKWPAIAAAIDEAGETLLFFWTEREDWGQDNDEVHFTWLCPGCGASNGGVLGDQPVSGWDNPRWVRSGDDAHLSLTPSLGCPLWRVGDCIGHWWARDGRLVLA